VLAWGQYLIFQWVLSQLSKML